MIKGPFNLMPKHTQSDETLCHEVHEFQSAFRSVLMATVNQNGTPEASYAPFVTDDSGRYFVFVSGLARHTRDLQETGRVSLLFIEDEGAAQNLFARQRLSFQCKAGMILRESTEWNEILERFTQRFGNFIDMVRGLPDFQLFQLIPRSGSYVRGFGQAFQFEGQGLDLIHQVRET